MVVVVVVWWGSSGAGEVDDLGWAFALHFGGHCGCSCCQWDGGRRGVVFGARTLAFGTGGRGGVAGRQTRGARVGVGAAVGVRVHTPSSPGRGRSGGGRRRRGWADRAESGRNVGGRRHGPVGQVSPELRDADGAMLRRSLTPEFEFVDDRLLLVTCRGFRSDSPKFELSRSSRAESRSNLCFCR